MIWRRCAGTWGTALRVERGRAICPRCTRYLAVKPGQLVPHHKAARLAR